MSSVSLPSIADRYDLKPVPMRELTRPALFMIARLGLFLTLLAWAAGQWHRFSVLIPVPTGTAGAELTAASWQFRYVRVTFNVGIENFSEVLVSPPMACLSLRQLSLHEKFQLTSAVNCYLSRLPEQSTNTGAGGVSQGVDPMKDYINVPHWLLVTVVMAFNIFLHVIYCKRPEVPPCES